MIKTFKTKRLSKNPGIIQGALREDSLNPPLDPTGRSIRSGSPQAQFEFTEAIETTKLGQLDSEPGNTEFDGCYPSVSLSHLNGTTNSETIKLAILHQMFKQCADPEARLLQRSEASSLCQLIRAAQSGPLLPQVGELINLPAAVIQKELMRVARKPILRIEPFLSQLDTLRMSEFWRVLSPHGILPLFNCDRLLTVLVDFPSMCHCAQKLCQESRINVQWCHPITIRSDDLSSILCGTLDDARSTLSASKAPHTGS